MGSKTFVFESIEILFSKYLYLNTFLKYLTFSNTFKYSFFQIHCQYQYFGFKITCNACQTNYLHCNFTQQALAMTTTFVCSEPEDGLAPDSDHRSISPLFFSQVPSWHQAILVPWMTFEVELSHFLTRS